MPMIDVDKLVPHEKNSYFFDDMTGEAWMAFLESVETSGIIEPVVAVEDSHIIISGHQRVRAAKHFKMKQVPVTFRKYTSDDEILKQLIETNIRQRGIGNTNPVKFGRCIAELERIYGIKNGGDRKSDGHNVQLKTQDDLADELEISKKQLNRYKSLTDLIPELQDAVQSGQITATTAMGFVKKLTPEEQAELAEQISGEEKVSSAEIKKYTEQIERLKKAKSEREMQLILEKQDLEKQLEEANNREPKTVEVEPKDYKSIKAKAKEADAWRKDYQNEQLKVSEKNKEILTLKDQIEELKSQTAQATSSAKLIEGSIYFVAQCGSFVRDMGGYVWIADKIAELPENERTNFMKAIAAIHDWAEILQQNVERNM